MALSGKGHVIGVHHAVDKTVEHPLSNQPRLPERDLSE